MSRCSPNSPANLQPFFGAVFALAVLSESLGALQVVGGIVVGTGIVLARWLELLSRLDGGRLFDGEVTVGERRDVSVLKTWCDEALFRIADPAIQVHGGRGLLTATGLERIFRVARNLRIPAGTTEVQRAVIADALEQVGPA